MSASASRCVRPALAEDAPIIAILANRLNRTLGVEGDPFTPEGVLAHAFGTEAHVRVLLAELDGRIVGYAMLHAAYDSDIAAPAVCLVDLFVEPNARRHGLGRALMAASARDAVHRGARTLAWGVHEANAGALAFYRALGATGGPVRVLELKDEALRKVAEGGEF